MQKYPVAEEIKPAIRATLLETMPSWMVVAGAALSFVALTIDYYGYDFDRSFGRTQALALFAGLAAMLVGAGFEVRSGRRTLAETVRFWAIAGQVAIVAQAIKLYEIENRIFYDVIILLILFGFIANHYLPTRLRLPFVFLLGVGAIIAVLGVSHPVAAAWLIGLSLGIFAVANLPIALWARVALLVTIGLILAALRAGYIETSWSNIVVPLLASVFLFRLIIYLYDVHNKRGPTSIWARLAYFFLPPNPVFPFFPVVDFTTFGRTYYNQDALDIYQRGANWILRGLIHLLIYRIIYLNFLLSPESVRNPGEFLQFIVANFALYLRISGSFHMIVGMLLLFGFNLHETHARFLFSNSFIDFWRRINIYWKDFMQKMFFNPSYLWLKNRGLPHIAGVLGAIAVTFVATWALHSYQWFWLRGSVLLSWPDILFWVLLGAFLMAQTVMEDQRRGQPQTGRGLLGAKSFLVLRTVCTFMTICLIWSMWTSDSLAAWFDLLATAGILPAFASSESATAADWATTIAAIGAALFMASIAMGITFGLGSAAPEPQRRLSRATTEPSSWWQPAGAVLAPALALLALQAPALKERMGIDAQLFVEDISRNRLNAKDQALMTRGYYENLTNAHRFNSPLWEVFMFRPNNYQELEDMAGMRRRNDYVEFEYQPSSKFSANGVTYAINRWGMRDDDYDQAKPPNTLRIAIVEASRASGLGVEHEDGFEARLERRLNADIAAKGHPKYEVLNFSVDGYSPIGRLLSLEEKVWPFAPDIVFYIAGNRDALDYHIASMFRKGIPAPYPFLDDVFRRAGLDRSMSLERLMERLAPYQMEVLGEIYRRFAEACKRRGATPVWFYMPGIAGMSGENAEEVSKLTKLARDAGFVMLDLPDVFATQVREAIMLGPWDQAHPNAFGHKLVADALFEQLLQLDRRGDVKLGLGGPLSGTSQ